MQGQVNASGAGVDVSRGLVHEVQLHWVQNGAGNGDQCSVKEFDTLFCCGEERAVQKGFLVNLSSYLPMATSCGL